MKIKSFLKNVVVLTSIALVAGGVGAIVFSSSTVTAQVPQVITVEAKAPILDRIADCESGNGKTGTGSQLNKNGQVVLNVNTNGTVDIGKYQINTIHEAEATKLGFNLFTLEGNTAYAKYMYANYGTGDWASSQGCWKK